MNNKNINEQLQLFPNDNFKMNFHENVEGESYSVPASTIVEEIKSLPEESVPNGKTEANLKNKKNTRKRGRYPMYRKMSEIELNTVKYSLN